MELTIRTARREDYPAVAALEGEMQRLHAAARPDIFAADAPAYSEEAFAELLDDPAGIPLAAERDGEIVGICLAGVTVRKSAILTPGSDVYIDDVAVRPDCRRQGIASALLAELKARATALGADTVFLKVWAFNENAERLYRAMGMTTRSAILEWKLNEQEIREK